MKKTLMIIMALMLMAVPMTAMADASVDDGGGGAFTYTPSGATGSTEFKVEVSTANISVTVPVSLVFVANAEGGDLTMPGDYKIVNNSKMKLKVTNIATAISATPTGASVAPTLSGSRQTTGGDSVNVFQVSVNNSNLTTTGVEPNTNVWNIPAAAGEGETTTSGELPLALGGSNSPLDFTAAGVAVTLFNVTYTIAPGAYA